MLPKSQLLRRLAPLCLSLLAVACGKKEPDVTLAAAASSLAPSKPDAGSMVTKYVLDPKGSTSIDMPAPQEHIKAKTSAAAGSLDVDLKNLSNTRGEVKIDLTTLTTATFEDTEKNKSQTTHALNWLEVGDLATADQKGANKYAVFAIRTIDGLSATDATTLPTTKEGDDDVRTVTMTAHGEILLHGRKANKDATLEVKLHYPAGALPDTRPTSIVVKTKEPMKVVLAEHDVKPRDTEGKLAAGALNLIGTKVADVATITFELPATLAK